MPRHGARKLYTCVFRRVCDLKAVFWSQRVTLRRAQMSGGGRVKFRRVFFSDFVRSDEKNELFFKNGRSVLFLETHH